MSEDECIGIDLPFNYNDTQEEKLRKVREELLDVLREHSHGDIGEMMKDLSMLKTDVGALSLDVAFLKDTVLRLLSAQAQEEPIPGDVWVNCSEAIPILKNAGVKYVNKRLVYHTLVMMGYVSEKYIPTKKAKGCVRKNAGERYDSLELNTEFVKNTLAKSMLKMEEVLE